MRRRNHAERLRSAVEMLPENTREAMLRGMDANEIIVGAYTDRDGGICPMLAAHRNGGRTNFASFARAWDAYTRARRPRRATRREVRTLRTYLEMSLLGPAAQAEPLGAVVDAVRSERRRSAERAAWGDGRAARADEGSDSSETAATSRPTRRLDILEATAAEELDGPTVRRETHPVV